MDLDDLLAGAPSLNPPLPLDVDSAYVNVARRSRRRRRLRRIAFPILGLALAGAVAESVALTSDPDDSGIDQRSAVVWRQDPSAGQSGSDGALIRGELRYRDDADCFVVVVPGAGSYPVVWPANTEPVAGAPAVRLPDGEVVEPGATIEGGGSFLAPSDLSPSIPVIPSTCLAPNNEVAAFNADAVVEVEVTPTTE